MKYRSSKKTSLLILNTLADQKEYAQYDLPKAISKDYRTVLRHLQDMEKHHLVYLARTERSKYGGKDKKIYGLTLLGLFEVIHSLSKEELDNKIDTIAKKHADKLPLVFGKWEHFAKHGFREKAIFNLETMPTAYLLRAQFATSSKFPQYYSRLEEGITHTFCFFELRMLHFFDVPSIDGDFLTVEDLKIRAKESEEIERWLSMLMLDVDLRKYVEKEFDWLILLTSKYLDALRNIRKLTVENFQAEN